MNEWKVFAIIVTYQPDIKILERQIRNLTRAYHVILIDNASSNVSDIKSICTSDPKKIFLKCISKNVGLAAAQNIGISVSRHHHATHVILFDQDSYMDTQSIERLKCESERLQAMGHKLAAIGPLSYDPKNLQQYPISVFYGPILRRTFMNEEQSVEASFIISSGSLIALSVLDVVGGMMEELFIDYIDIEWCYRAQSMGFSVFATSFAKMEHTIGDARVRLLGRTISKHSALRRYYLLRNSIKIMSLRHIPIAYKAREVALMAARTLVFFAISSERKSYLKYMYYALADSFSGRYGKYERGGDQ